MQIKCQLHLQHKQTKSLRVAPNLFFNFLSYTLKLENKTRNIESVALVENT